MDEGRGFIRSRIKDKPLDKKKFMMRLGMAVVLGVLFGLVAAVSYTAGVYHLENTVYQTPVREVVISEAEAKPESPDQTDEVVLEEDRVEETEPKVVKAYDLESYEQLYTDLYDIAKDAAKSMLPVHAVTEDADWFSDTFESSKGGSGLVIADNRREFLILVDNSIIADAREIQVTLPDESTVSATTKKYDPYTGMAIIGIPIADIKEEVRDEIIPAQLGTSTGDVLLGKPVIAIGSPLGVSDSVSYGIVTSSSKMVQKPDEQLQLLTTDICGSSNGSGILVNLKGQTMGIITQEEYEDKNSNLICAYGISGMKSSIERMANGRDKAYLGIYGADVTKEVMESLSIPEGAYITAIDVDSPAMDCGMQSGDVITAFGTSEIKSFSDFETAMNKSLPGDEAVITVERASRNGYSEMTFSVILGTVSN